MPEFHLNIAGAYPTWVTLDDFTKGYLEAAFFADCPEGPEWENVSLADMTPDAWQAVRNGCGAFQTKAEGLREEAISLPHSYDLAQAGRDFWLTRQGHGAGFWDRGLGEAGEALSALCGYGTDWPPVDFEEWFPG